MKLSAEAKNRTTYPTDIISFGGGPIITQAALSGAFVKFLDQYIELVQISKVKIRVKKIPTGRLLLYNA